MLDHTIRRRIGGATSRIVLCIVLLIGLMTLGAFAQSGGGGASGGGSAGGSGVGGANTGGSVTSPSTRSSSTGPQSGSPAMRPSPIPRANTGVPPVPSAGNAEPNSPIYRQDAKPGSLPAQPGGLQESTRSQTDAPIGGSGGTGTGSGSSGADDPLTPTDSVGNPALGGSGDEPTSITEEPERIKRAGAAGRNLDECMKLWDPGTHMTKDRWKETCVRLGR